MQRAQRWSTVLTPGLSSSWSASTARCATCGRRPSRAARSGRAYGGGSGGRHPRLATNGRLAHQRAIRFDGQPRQARSRCATSRCPRTTCFWSARYSERRERVPGRRASMGRKVLVASVAGLAHQNGVPEDEWDTAASSLTPTEWPLASRSFLSPTLSGEFHKFWYPCRSWSGGPPPRSAPSPRANRPRESGKATGLGISGILH
jgi:hypothetical protein